MARIIVFGVSGVGKTTACRHYVARHPNYVHLSASALIREATGASVADLQLASVDRLLANQSILHDALEAKLRNSGVSNFILDGQCVLDNGKELVVLDVELVAPFSPAGLILLEASAQEIVRRRAADERQRPYRTEQEILVQIQMNRDAVQSYAVDLGIRFVVAEANSPLSLEGPMAEVLGSL